MDRQSQHKTKHWFHDQQATDQESLNLVEFPLALLARSIPKSQKVVSFEDSIFDQSTKQRVARKLTISANIETDLPNYWDQDVLLALSILTWRKNKFTDPVVEFTLREVLRLMQLSGQGANCKRLAKSFDNWLGLRFKWSHWWNGDTWEHPKATVLIQDYDLTRKPGNSSPTAPQVFAWSRLYFEAMQTGNCKPFDGDFYFGLKTPTAKRLYRYLDKRFFNRVNYSSPIEPFCTEKLGIARGRKPSQYPAKINDAYDELVSQNYLADLPKTKRFTRDKSGLLTVNFKRGRGQTTKSSVTVQVPAKAPIEQQLIDFGMTPSTATNLAQSQPDECAAQIEYFQFRNSTGWQPDKGAAAYLRTAIRDGYSPPDGFKSKADREREAAAIQKAKKDRHEAQIKKQKEDAKRDAQDKAKEAAETTAINNYLASLSPTDREQCIEAAIEKQNPFARTRARKELATGEQGIWLNMALRDHIRPLLDTAASQ